jgi:hypothetical protein
MTAAVNGQDVWKGVAIGAIAGGLMGAAAGVAGLFITPILAGGTVVLGAGGVTLGAGAALGIGSAIAFVGGFVVGMASDLRIQHVNRQPGQKIDWGAAAWSGLQWGVINTISAFTGGLAGELARVASFALSLFYNFMYGSIGLLIDVIRGQKPKVNTKLPSNSNSRQIYAFGRI